MKLKDILSIGGKPGLYKYLSQAKNGIIVEGLKDKKRFPAYSTAKVSSLEDIAVFTETDEVKLSEVFDRIYQKEEGGLAVSHKSTPEELRAYFEGILPDYDRERVYISDIKKIIAWYNFLHETEMLIQEDEKDAEENAGVEKEVPDKDTEEKKSSRDEEDPEGDQPEKL